MTFWVLTFIAEMLEVKGTLYFFDTFMEKRDGGYRNRYRFFVYCGVLYLVAVTGAWIGMLKCIPIILVMSFLNLAYYEVSFRQSFLFSIINYTMLVLIDYVTVLLGRGGSIQEKWFLQALISKTVFIILMLFIRRFSKTRKSCGLITGKEWFQFFCVPVFTVVDRIDCKTRSGIDISTDKDIRFCGLVSKRICYCSVSSSKFHFRACQKVTPENALSNT